MNLHHLLQQRVGRQTRSSRPAIRCASARWIAAPNLFPCCNLVALGVAVD